MENSLYIALSQQMALRRQLEVTANNVANMNTAGYKGEEMLFLDYLMRPDQPSVGRDQSVLMVTDEAVVRNQAAGRLEMTENPLDVGIVGDGYLVVQTPGGQRYSRNGHLALDAAGQIVDINGLPVLDTGSAPIEIPEGTQDITIGRNGTISADGNIVGQLNLVTFEDPNSLKLEGGSLLTSEAQPQPAADTELVQGMVEGSNIEPVVEMTQMIDILRKYQAAQELINTEHDRERNAIQTLGRVPTA
jgi:flagellar basal-body rod protein FlgF